MIPTKFHLFGWNDKGLGNNPSADRIYSEVMKTVGECFRELHWGFELERPIYVEMVEKKVVEKVEEKHLFGKSEMKDVSKITYNYFLIFVTELDEYQLNLWRMFKIGIFTKNIV